MHDTFDYDVDEDEDDYELVLTSFGRIVSHAKTSCLNGISFGVVTKVRANQWTSG